MALMEFMARGERGVEKSEAAPSQMAVVPPRRISPSTSVDASTELQGNLYCKETLRIDGRVEGTVTCEKTVLVGEEAKVLASITADEVTVSGLVHGDIVARRKITLARTAVVKGDLTTPGIVIEEGAKLKGRIVIGADEDELQDAKPSTATKKVPVDKTTGVVPPKRDETPVAAASA
jgi:cytoskeletal protein CcmA (bactofilin family)